MVSKIRFGVFDIFLGILLIALIILNVWAYSKDDAVLVDPRPQAGVLPKDMDTELGSSEVPGTRVDPDIGEISGKPVEPDIWEIAGTWDATVRMFSGEDQSKQVYEYQFMLKVTKFSQNSFNIVYTQISGERTDDQPGDPATVEGLALGSYNDGILSFGLPGDKEKQFHVTFNLSGGALSGYGDAAAKAEWDYNTTIEMVKN
jgi:hypothetical protein